MVPPPRLPHPLIPLAHRLRLGPPPPPLPLPSLPPRQLRLMLVLHLTVPHHRRPRVARLPLLLAPQLPPKPSKGTSNLSLKRSLVWPLSRLSVTRETDYTVSCDFHVLPRDFLCVFTRFSSSLLYLRPTVLLGSLTSPLNCCIRFYFYGFGRDVQRADSSNPEYTVLLLKGPALTLFDS